MNKIEIGNTPLTKSYLLSNKFGCHIYIKEEYRNPGESSKDRVAWYMIQDALKRKKIEKGGTFVEASSGNTGISIALMASELGYQSKIFVSKSCSDEKLEILEKYGASVQICDNGNGLHDFNSTQYLAQSYASNHPNCYFTNQYYNSANIKAHYLTTGPEIWSQTAGKVTHFIAGIGTGGSISGVGRFLKEKNSAVKIWGVEPKGSIYNAFLNSTINPEKDYSFDAIEGIGRTFIPGSFDCHAVDQVFQVSQQDAKQIARIYKKQYDHFLGFSSAAVLTSLTKNLEEMNLQEDDHVVLYYPDFGDRYLNKLYHPKEFSEIRGLN